MRRQASLQYFTSAQLLAQRLRQLMVRPQATQGLLGSAALLPRKVVTLADSAWTPVPRRIRSDPSGWVMDTPTFDGRQAMQYIA